MSLPVSRGIPEAVPELELHGRRAGKGTGRQMPSNEFSDAHPVEDRVVWWQNRRTAEKMSLDGELIELSSSCVARG